ncbi:hypothetical protein ABT247_20390 [Kitasatospora sp. NPDC001539]|uniref:hypothetical protein n=1 Tax=unclassified Kitasatospora TaxID=2633591 RepID=UPI003316D2C5
MTIRPLNTEPDDGDAAVEPLSVSLPAGLPAETRQALEFAVRAAAEAVMAGRMRVTEAPAGSDTAELAFEVPRSDVPPALAEGAPGRAARRAAMVARIRAANAETLERLKDL